MKRWKRILVVLAVVMTVVLLGSMPVEACGRCGLFGAGYAVGYAPACCPTTTCYTPAVSVSACVPTTSCYTPACSPCVSGCGVSCGVGGGCAGGACGVGYWSGYWMY